MSGRGLEAQGALQTGDLDVTPWIVCPGSGQHRLPGIVHAATSSPRWGQPRQRRGGEQHRKGLVAFVLVLPTPPRRCNVGHVERPAEGIGEVGSRRRLRQRNSRRASETGNERRRNLECGQRRHRSPFPSRALGPMLLSDAPPLCEALVLGRRLAMPTSHTGFQPHQPIRACELALGFGCASLSIDASCEKATRPGEGAQAAFRVFVLRFLGRRLGDTPRDVQMHGHT
mmetsp:Transcript_8200/g.23424  ORF Transcript_8200/g.23424 Transcript_8200/m.23424 type:complete len:228 (+) Transcript_8200:180-863(+)